MNFNYKIGKYFKIETKYGNVDVLFLKESEKPDTKEKHKEVIEFLELGYKYENLEEMFKDSD